MEPNELRRVSPEHPIYFMPGDEPEGEFDRADWLGPHKVLGFTTLEDAAEACRRIYSRPEITGIFKITYLSGQIGQGFLKPGIYLDPNASPMNQVTLEWQARRFFDQTFDCVWCRVEFEEAFCEVWNPEYLDRPTPPSQPEQR